MRRITSQKLLVLLAGANILLLIFRQHTLMASLMAMFGLSIIIFMWFRFHEDRKNKEKPLLDVISFCRHESMNHLQVIYGYVTLKKYDRIVSYIQKVTEVHSRDTNTSQLGIFPLNEYLLTYNVFHRHLKLELHYSENFPVPVPEKDKTAVDGTLRAAINYFEHMSSEEGLMNELGIILDQIGKIYVIHLAFTSGAGTADDEPIVDLSQAIYRYGGIVAKHTENEEITEIEIHLPRVD